MNRKRYGSIVLVIYCNVYFSTIGRYQGRNFFRPFDETHIAGIEVLLASDVVCLCLTFDPVIVEVVDFPAVGGQVFIHNGKRRAAHPIPDTKLRAKSLDQSRLSRTHLTIK